MVKIATHISDSFAADGLNIGIVASFDDGGRSLLRVEYAPSEESEHTAHTGHSWERIDTLVVNPPSLVLPHEIARSLLDALLRRYEGSQDHHTLRADLVYERSRRERLETALLDSHSALVGYATAGTRLLQPLDRTPPV